MSEALSYENFDFSLPEDSNPIQKTYELSLSRDYVSHWGYREAIRELLQNAIDNLKDCEDPLDYEFNGLHLHIRSHGVTLPASKLLLGSSSKKDDDKSIGNFGEGFKLAMLVLTRLGHEVVIHNGDVMWFPKFQYSEQYDAEVLVIEEMEMGVKGRNLLEFEIRGIDVHMQDYIRHDCLHMQKLEEQDVIRSELGEILTLKKGKLYVGGLFICDTKFEFGYNFHPSEIRVERDRQTVDGFDLKFKTKDMWYSCYDDVSELLADLIERQCPDLEYAEYKPSISKKQSIYAKTQDKLVQKYEASYSGRKIVSSQSEVELFSRQSPSNPPVILGVMGAIVKDAPAYQEKKVFHEPVKTPQEFIIEQLNDHHRAMARLPRRTRDAIDAILAESKFWRVQ